MNNWNYSLSGNDIEKICTAAIDKGIVTSQDKSVVFHDLNLLRSRIEELHALFPTNALHTIAIKANPLIEVLKICVEEGAGLEAASFEELEIGIASGCPPSKLLFDSPAKTNEELESALEQGIRINADNFSELERINQLLKNKTSTSKIGLRINPIVGSGSIGITSVGDESSKFGVRLDHESDAILDAFRNYPWLIGLHVHIGSQGCDLELLTTAAQRIQVLRDKIEESFGETRISYIDIGGGLPTKYLEDDNPPTLHEYVSQLREKVPQLFDEHIQLVTEFGRAVHASCGIALTRVEYIKTLHNLPLAVVHLGADMMMRPVYLPQYWKHRYFAVNNKGELKAGQEFPWVIGGPLCFAGDILTHNTLIPNVETGDYIAIGDVGAYTVGLWSRHCSRGIPLILGYEGIDKDFIILRHRETPSDLVRYWGRDGV